MKETALLGLLMPMLVLALVATSLALSLGVVVPVTAQATSLSPIFDSNETGPEAAADSITTVLHPGWNQVAWLGPEAPVTVLFDAVPAVLLAYSWDAAAQGFSGRSRNSTALRGLSRLTPGMGLLILVGGDEAVKWSSPRLAGSMLLQMRKGWNLVSWAGRDGVPVESALERFGGLLVGASWWNAEARAYEQYRPEASSVPSSSSLLDHGDAIWLMLEGDVLWWQSEWGTSMVVSERDLPKEQQADVRGWTHETRDIETGQLAGLLPVKGGVGLVTWGGGPASDLVDEARTRGCRVAEVRVTDPGAVDMIRYLPTRLKSPNADFTSVFPEDLPALMPVMVTCMEPDTPRVAFIGDVPSDLQRLFLAEVESVIDFFSEQHRVAVQDLSVYVAMGLSEGAPLYYELNPGGFLGYAQTAGLAQSYIDEQILLVLGTPAALGHHVFARILSHEYFHLLQWQLQQKENPHWGAGPWWLLEGTAHYADELYESAMGYDAFEDWYDGQYAHLSSSRNNGTYDLRELESHHDLGRPLAILGTRYLMDRYGAPSSHVQFWQGLDDVRGWRESFADVFGVTVDDFYREFRAHYDSLFGAIHVAIDDPVPDLPGALALSFGGGGGKTGYAYTAVVEDGTARVEVLPGSYSVRPFFNVQIGTWSSTEHLGSLRASDSSAESHTVVKCQIPDKIVTVGAGEIAEVSVRLPVYHEIVGALQYANDAPVGNTDGVKVAIHGLSDDFCFEGPHPADSSLHFFLPEGSSFSLEVWRDGTPVAWYGPDGLTTDPDAAVTFTVSGADLTLPSIELPAAVADQ